MLAEYFYEKDHLNIHRNYLAGNNLQLHGWNRFIAEKAALQHAELAMKQKQNMKSTKLESSNDDSIAFKAVDIVAPGGVCCASDLTVKIEQGSPLIVTGPMLVENHHCFEHWVDYGQFQQVKFNGLVILMAS